MDSIQRVCSINGQSVKTGTERHWLIPLKKSTQYEVVRKLGRQDAIVRINSSARSRKYWPGLPEQIEVRLVSRKIRGC